MDQNIDSLLERAEGLAATRDFAHARQALQAAETLAPDDARAPLQLSYVESLDGRYRAAREAALRAHALRPRGDAVVRELVRRLRTFNEAGALRECMQRLPPLREVSIPLLLTFAAQLSYLNRQDEALALLDEAHRGDPDYPPTLVSRGQVLTYLGRFDEAEADLMRCVRRAPELASAWWSLSRLRRQTPESNHIDAIRTQRGAQWEPATAALGPSIELAGAAALTPPPAERDWKAWLLWGVLLAGAALVAGFAVSLLRKPTG